MRNTLRRSCDACAKSKLSCDLQTPQCSRCAKRGSLCAYANQPLSAALANSTPTPPSRASSFDGETSVIQLTNPGIQSFDPFDTYPQIRLPRPHVQRLIQHCKFDQSSVALDADRKQSCLISPSSTIPWTLILPLTRLLSPGGLLLLQTPLCSTYHFRLHHLTSICALRRALPTPKY